MKRLLVGAALLVAAVGTPLAQTPPSPMESRAAELRDGLTVLIAMAKQSDQAAAEATRRLEQVRAAVGGDPPPAPPAPVVAPTPPQPVVAPPLRMGLERAPAPPTTKSVWDFSPVVAALIQSLLLAIATLTPVVIAWAAWELRRRTGIAARRADAAVLSCAVKNSIGAMEQNAAELGQLPEPSVATSYVLLHAGDEADRLGINSTAIAEKVAAQIGLQSLALRASAAAAPVYTILPPVPSNPE